MKKLKAYMLNVGLTIFVFSFISCSYETEIHSLGKLKDNTGYIPSNQRILEPFKNFTSNFEKCGLAYTSLLTLDETCTTTDFARILFQHISELVNDPAFDPILTHYYVDLNKKYVTHYRGDNYFGENGQFTQLAQKRSKELDKFWKLEREIILNGQHTISLNDRESLAAMIESFDPDVRNREEAYSKADALLAYNENSPNYPENPFFAIDAFTRRNGLLVIGDGLLQTLIESGIDENVAFTGVLSHEWWHQVQYEFENSWNLQGDQENIKADIRFLELEADYAAAYFMAHKRGATFNWKRIEQFFKLSYNAGDCFIQSSQHHGTPRQRLSAARNGYELANIAKRKGFILSPEQVHQEFLEIYPLIIWE